MYKNLVDEVLDGKHEDAHIEKGCGRKVYIFDKVVVKVPLNTGEDVRSGSSQMFMENIIYNNSPSKMLCPILLSYRNCIVMKRIETHPDVLLEKTPDGKRFSEMLYDLYWVELNNLAEEYNLLMADLIYINNWGYDMEDNTFKCVDYGLIEDTTEMNLF